MCHIVNEIKSGFQINEQLLSNKIIFKSQDYLS